MSVRLQEQWTAKSNAVKGLADIYNIQDADTDAIVAINARMICTSFFLPREILDSKDLQVSQLAILPQEYFCQLWHTSGSLHSPHADVTHWKADTDMMLLLHAKHVGVSARWWGGHLFLVAKVWYGMPVVETPQAFNARFNKLLKFCKLERVVS